MAYDGEQLKDAVNTAASSGVAIELIVKNENRFRTVHLTYRDGLRYPRLERDSSASARLDDILKAR